VLKAINRRHTLGIRFNEARGAPARLAARAAARSQTMGSRVLPRGRARAHVGFEGVAAGVHHGGLHPVQLGGLPEARLCPAVSAIDPGYLQIAASVPPCSGGSARA